MLVEAGMGQAAPAAHQEDGSWCGLAALRIFSVMSVSSYFARGIDVSRERRALALERALGPDLAAVLMESAS